MSDARKLLNDCFLHDKDRLRHDEAIAIILDQINAIAGTEIVSLEDASGRYLAKAVKSPRDVPLTDNAAVDGYAYRHEDFEAAGGWFEVVDRIAAGHTRQADVPKNAAVRIFTGATVPDGLDTVAMQEDCEPHVQDGLPFVAIPPGLKAGANRRKAGEDVLEGTTMLMPGERIRPQELAAIASLGIAEVSVFKKLRVALLATGDELQRPDSQNNLKPGQVYDSNSAMLKGLLETLPVTITNFGILKDDAELVESTLSQAAAEHDLILTSGGASRGEEDHIITSLDKLGKRHMWQLAIKPGRPMCLGQIDDCAFVGLPGNPVAAFVCFLLYVRPILLRMHGATYQEPVRYSVNATFSIANKKPDRREFLRGILGQDGNGGLTVSKFERDGSGLITGLREADGLIEIDEAATSLQAGTPVSFIPFSQFGLLRH
ncbi:MAG: molybdopterin molybdenumtransferase MoeA [Hyphomicrobiales bacterium]|nr:MAG: molybdopterin molybdenumtransferase MoeA [Hyphomicrobiales bacterium]